MKPPRRILLVRLSHLGDVVHALPVFHALRAGYPEAELAWVVQGEFAELVEGLSGLDRTLRFDRRGGARAWTTLHAELARFGADWAIDAQGNTKSALIALASGAGRRSGYHPAQWTERFGALGLTDRADLAVAAPRARGTPRPMHSQGHAPEHAPAHARAPAPAHALDRALALARHVAPHVDPGAARFDPLVTDAERDAGHAALTGAFADRDVSGGVLIQLAVPGDVRAWPAESAAELARTLAREDVPTLVLSGPGEAAAGRAVREFLGAPAPGRSSRPVAHVVGQRGLRALAGLFAAAAERGFRLVGCDSGPSHVAAACGLPVILLAGPQDPRRTGPWPVPDEAHASPAAWVASPGAYAPGDASHRIVTARSAPACAPCLRRTCDHPEGPVCMTRIDPEQVGALVLHDAAPVAAPMEVAAR